MVVPVIQPIQARYFARFGGEPGKIAQSLNQRAMAALERVAR